MASLEISSRLLNSSIFKRPVRDPDLLAQIERGEFATAPANRAGWLKRTKMPEGCGPHGEFARQNRVRDRVASKGRRRALGGAGCIPHAIRCQYTEGERAALTVIALEVKRRGRCEMPVEKIAALAGVSKRTVQYALATARASERQHIHVEYRPVKGRRDRTNVVTIIAADWLVWLKRGPSLDSIDRGIGCKPLHTTKKGQFYSDRTVGRGASFGHIQPSGGAAKRLRGKERAQGRVQPAPEGVRHAG